jgi:hypothetical protein
VFIERHRRADGNPALTELTHPVHAADGTSDIGSHPFGAALRAIAVGGLDEESANLRLLERALFVYDALSPCRRSVRTRAGRLGEPVPGRAGGPHRRGVRRGRDSCRGRPHV